MRKKVVPRALLGACTENLPSELVLLAPLHHSLAVLPALFPPPHLTSKCYHLTSECLTSNTQLTFTISSITLLGYFRSWPPSRVFLYSSTPIPCQEEFFGQRKTRKSLVCSKPEQAYLSWSSLSRRWTSPVASRPLLRLVSTSPPACNKLSFFWIFCC